MYPTLADEAHIFPRILGVYGSKCPGNYKSITKGFCTRTVAWRNHQWYGNDKAYESWTSPMCPLWFIWQSKKLLLLYSTHKPAIPPRCWCMVIPWYALAYSPRFSLVMNSTAEGNNPQTWLSQEKCTTPSHDEIIRDRRKEKKKKDPPAISKIT